MDPARDSLDMSSPASPLCKTWDEQVDLLSGRRRTSLSDQPTSEKTASPAEGPSRRRRWRITLISASVMLGLLAGLLGYYLWPSQTLHLRLAGEINGLVPDCKGFCPLALGLTVRTDMDTAQLMFGPSSSPTIRWRRPTTRVPSQSTPPMPTGSYWEKTRLSTDLERERWILLLIS